MVKKRALQTFSDSAISDICTTVFCDQKKIDTRSIFFCDTPGQIGKFFSRREKDSVRVTQRKFLHQVNQEISVEGIWYPNHVTNIRININSKV